MRMTRVAGIVAKASAAGAVALSMAGAQAAVVDFFYGSDIVATMTTSAGVLLIVWRSSSVCFAP